MELVDPLGVVTARAPPAPEQETAVMHRASASGRWRLEITDGIRNNTTGRTATYQGGRRPNAREVR
jgi:hypothetical protein